MQNTNDTVNAFIEMFTVVGASQQPLSGRTVGVKDLFDVAGKVTGCGNPDWLNTHTPASQNAAAVDLLVKNGATILGKTHTDELAYSLLGINSHYGVPINSAAPDRLPGGSSSGSAAAVAGAIVDIGLGSDTGGSIRIPASFCGLYGLRTSHGVIPLKGIMPLAPSFDTVGWMTKDLDLLTEIARVCGLKKPSEQQRKLLFPEDIWRCADSEVVDSLLPTLTLMEEIWGPCSRVTLAKGHLEQWRKIFQICQAAEIWQCHRDWITQAAPSFGPGVRERFENASQVSDTQWLQAKLARQEIKNTIQSALAVNVIVIPTSPTVALLRNENANTLESFRNRALQMLCPAGLAGCPQLTLPAGKVEGIPTGLSIIGPPGSDADVLEMACMIEKEKNV